MIYHDMTEDILTDFHPWLKNNHFHALIDFGVMAVGDPACDYAMAWTYFDKKARKIFLDELKEDMVDRARGWALWKALITYNDENPIPRENAHLPFEKFYWKKQRNDCTETLAYPYNKGSGAFSL